MAYTKSTKTSWLTSIVLQDDWNNPWLQRWLFDRDLFHPRILYCNEFDNKSRREEISKRAYLFAFLRRFSRNGAPLPLIQGKDGFQTVAAGKFKKDARKEQRLWAFWVAITRSVLKLLTPVILFCISPPLPASRLPFRLSPPLPAYPSENHAAGNYLKMPSRRSPQKRNILRSFQSRTRQYRGKGRRRKDTMPKSWRGRKGFLLFFWRKERTNFCPLYSSPNLERFQEGNRYTLTKNAFERNVSRILQSRETHLVGISINSACCFYYETLGKLFHRLMSWISWERVNSKSIEWGMVYSSLQRLK